MKITRINLLSFANAGSGTRSNPKKRTSITTKNVSSRLERDLANLALLQQANVDAVAHNTKLTPAQKLYKIETGKEAVEDNPEVRKRVWTVKTGAGTKAWDTANYNGHIRPGGLLKEPLNVAISSILTLNNIDNPKETYEIPTEIKTPNYGDNWGRRANFIEINPRLLAETKEVLLEDYIEIEDYYDIIDRKNKNKNRIRDNGSKLRKADRMVDDLGVDYIEIAPGMFEKKGQNRFIKDGKVKVYTLVRHPEEPKAVKTDYKTIKEYAEIKNNGFSKDAGETFNKISPNTYEKKEQEGKINTKDGKYIQVYRTNYRLSKGLINAIKLLPAIPPSAKHIPNCIQLAQIFPPKGSWHDGELGDDGIYNMDLDATLAKSLGSTIYTSDRLDEYGLKMSEEELIKAFNDLAHLRGLKTCLRFSISEGQLSINWRDFSWKTDKEDYINKCVKAVELGFDAIYFDSGKHVGNYDKGNYWGYGDPPDYKTMQDITMAVRKRTGRCDIAIAAEKTDTNPRYKELGYTVGHDYGCADSAEDVWSKYHEQEDNLERAAGIVISDDNDNGAMSYEQRLNRIRNAFSCFADPVRKLPVHMQMHDIFPLNWYTNTHDTMMTSRYHGTDGTAESHYDGIFANSDAAERYTMDVYKEFEKIMDKGQ